MLRRNGNIHTNFYNVHIHKKIRVLLVLLMTYKLFLTSRSHSLLVIRTLVLKTLKLDHFVFTFSKVSETRWDPIPCNA